MSGAYIEPKLTIGSILWRTFRRGAPVSVRIQVSHHDYDAGLGIRQRWPIWNPHLAEVPMRVEATDKLLEGMVVISHTYDGGLLRRWYGPTTQHCFFNITNYPGTEHDDELPADKRDVERGGGDDAHRDLEVSSRQDPAG